MDECSEIYHFFFVLGCCCCVWVFLGGCVWGVEGFLVGIWDSCLFIWVLIFFVFLCVFMGTFWLVCLFVFCGGGCVFFLSPGKCNSVTIFSTWCTLSCNCSQPGVCVMLNKAMSETFHLRRGKSTKSYARIILWFILVLIRSVYFAL